MCVALPCLSGGASAISSLFGAEVDLFSVSCPAAYELQSRQSLANDQSDEGYKGGNGHALTPIRPLLRRALSGVLATHTHVSRHRVPTMLTILSRISSLTRATQHNNLHEAQLMYRTAQAHPLPQEIPSRQRAAQQRRAHHKIRHSLSDTRPGEIAQLPWPCILGPALRKPDYWKPTGYPTWVRVCSKSPEPQYQPCIYLSFMHSPPCHCPGKKTKWL